MKIEDFVKITGIDFYTGVPDSQLSPLCDYLMQQYGTDSKHHIIGANEGNCAAIAAGYHLATGRTAAVYMQNSGEGNIINPCASLLNTRVYAIPVLFIIGWRGEPGLHDEPQHIYQGEITLKLLEDMEISSYVLDSETENIDLENAMNKFNNLFAEGKCAAIIVKRGSLSIERKAEYKNSFSMNREEVIRRIVRVSGNAPVISTTGKASRELFEIREENSQGHCFDFLTVGSMGHSSSIALGVALNKPDTKVWCIDGDGAALMHMGSMAVLGGIRPKNLIHIVINNNAHETVGGIPTAAATANLAKIAEACGYPETACAENYDELDTLLEKAKNSDGLCFIEVKCALGARANLGRPTTSAVDNKRIFMDYLNDFVTPLD